MKRYIIIAILLGIVVNVFPQAKQPTIMVVPSDAWCFERGYVTVYNNQGTTAKYPNYEMAFQENVELQLVITKITGMMLERGFPPKDLEAALKTLKSNSAEDAMMSSKESGMGQGETPMDMLKKTAKADIIMQLTWTVNTTGPKKSVTFILKGLDAYTDKPVATATGTGEPSFSAEVPILLEEAVLAHIDNFNATLMNHFEEMRVKGREVIVRVRRWDDWEEDLESYYGPDEEELGILIEDWMAENTVEGRFSTTDATENMMLFEQVRIPLYYERNGRERAMDTKAFATNLRKHLMDAYEIESKVTTKGLGRATVTLGGK